ncbi:dienelactone hydrolase family protein [Methylomonas sp. AM2-LC]|uniref:dienelactone hydrolase family protein n=1 Tax=Methylomonas sp. AM2-LC TaxID=3153301 RepID=UPI00326622E4
MARKTAHDFHPEALQIFDKYVHGDISRRDFLSSIPKYALLGLSAEALLEALNPKFAQAQEVKDNDPRIKATFVEYPSPHGNGKIRGYLVQPAHFTGKLPTVLVIHENRGLNPHIEDITRRLALNNFIAFAPDGLYSLGGYPGDEDKARELFQKLDKEKTQADFLTAAHILKKLPQGNGNVGAVGFCYGGGIVNYLATKIPDLAAGVPFYGVQPSATDAAKIKAPLLIHYAGVDERINAGWPAYESALQAANVNYEVHIYPGVQHGFNNNTTPRYDAATAKLAWDRTISFFNTYLRDS